MRDILIVEDGLHERERLEKLFSSNNYRVNAVESVTEAERLLQYEQFRLGILDIGLGDKSGSHLFDLIKRTGRVNYVIMFTGNPSVHLKQRFLDEGAVDYIVKASPDAQNDALLERVRSLLGSAEIAVPTGISLSDFVSLYVGESSQDFFKDPSGEHLGCSSCGAKEFVVTFNHRPQLPPLVEGRVVCSSCGTEMNPEVG